MKRQPMPIAPPVHPAEVANWGALRLRFMWAYDGHLAPEHRDCRFSAEATAAWLLRSGSVVLRCGDRVHRAGRGQWLFPPAKEGWQVFSEDARVLSIRFVAVWPDGTPLYAGPDGLTMPSSAFGAMEIAGRALAGYVRSELGESLTVVQERMTDLGRHLRLQELFHGWLRTYVEAMRRLGATPNLCLQHDDRLSRALRCLDEWPLGKPVVEKAVAQAAGLSVSQLNRLFVSKLRITPKRHFEIRRMEQAAALMAFGDLPAKTVAYRLGFSSLPHFSNWFKRHFGMAPTEYRGPTAERGEARA